jgi:hypothetical protein
VLFVAACGASVALLAVSLGVGLCPAPVRAADPPRLEPSVWMKQKLTASQNILAALNNADYDAIAANANSMLVVGYLEKFARADTPGYRELMGDFTYANKSLVLAAREKNLDGATIAYLQLTLSCVNCHKIVRGLGK